MQTHEHSEPLFDYVESLRQRDIGIALAADNNASLVIQAREIAFELVQGGKVISMDDVMAEWIRRGGGINDFGNSAGGIFRDRRFEWTGQFVSSERIHSHGNLLRTWRLKTEVAA